MSWNEATSIESLKMIQKRTAEERNQYRGPIA